MKAKNVILLLSKVIVICISVILIVMISDEMKRRKVDWKYDQVYTINNTHDATLTALGIEEIFYYDWEETANSLDIPIDSLTINTFLKHLLHEDN